MSCCITAGITAAGLEWAEFCVFSSANWCTSAASRCGRCLGCVVCSTQQKQGLTSSSGFVKHLHQVNFYVAQAHGSCPAPAPGWSQVVQQSVCVVLGWRGSQAGGHRGCSRSSSTRSQVPLSPHCAQLEQGGQLSALPPGSHSLPAVIAERSQLTTHCLLSLPCDILMCEAVSEGAAEAEQPLKV